MRMDKYKDESINEEEENVVDTNIVNEEDNTPTRSNRNKDMYREDYDGNVKILDPNELSQIFSQNRENVVVQEEEHVFVPKDYDIDHYIAKAHDGKENDNIVRSLDTDNQVDVIKEKKDNISKLMDSIQEKEEAINEDEELFGDLMPDDSDETEKTIVTDPVDESKLASVIGENTFADFAYKKQEEIEQQNIFKDLDKIEGVNSNRLPVIVLSISIGLLIIIAIIILLVKIL